MLGHINLVQWGQVASRWAVLKHISSTRLKADKFLVFIDYFNMVYDSIGDQTKWVSDVVYYGAVWDQQN